MYAIRAVVVIASTDQPGACVPLTKISEQIGAPSAFMAKVPLRSVHADIKISGKGHGGGFCIDPRNVERTKLGAVVKAMDGDARFSGCALGFPECDARKPCPIHEQVMCLRAELERILADVRIEQLGNELTQGTSYLRGKVT